MSDPKKISIRTDLLAAVARWTHADPTRSIGVVAFRSDNTIVATDAHRMVIVPHETHGLSFGVTRAHLLAAVAAQNVLQRDGMEPNVGHDVVERPDGDIVLADGPHGDREVRIWIDANRVYLDIGALVVRAPLVDIRQYPDVEKAIVGDSAGTPNGYLLDARYLAAIAEVNMASASYADGVRVVRWSALDANGGRGPVVLENVNGVKFAIMPQRDKGVS